MPLSAAAGPVLVIFNPVAGWRRRARFRAVLRLLAASGAEVTVRETTQRGDAEKLAQAAAASADAAAGARLLVAGGDGTVNEVVNGLDRGSLPLALLPLGTANVLAHEIGLALTAEAIADTALNGVARQVSLGRVNGRRFVLMAGIGFDARVVAGIVPRTKRWLGRGAYVLGSARELLHYRPDRYSLSIDGEPCAAASAVIANGRLYAGRYLLAPRARLDSPSLEVVLFTRPGRWSVLRYGTALLLGRLPKASGLEIVTASHITIDGPPGEPIQGDGDIIAGLPAVIDVVPEALMLMTPRGP